MSDTTNGRIPRFIPPQQELAQLMESNKAGFMELSRQGAQINPADLLHARIWILAKLVLGENTLEMQQFQLQYERQVSAAIEECRAQIRKAQLAAGAQITPEQMAQMAQAQGLLGPNGKPLQG